MAGLPKATGRLGKVRGPQTPSDLPVRDSSGWQGTDPKVGPGQGGSPSGPEGGQDHTETAAVQAGRQGATHQAQ